MKNLTFLSKNNGTLTMEQFNKIVELFTQVRKTKPNYTYVVFPRIHTKNGSVSIQGSCFNYSNPRCSDANLYSTMEIGFPTVDMYCSVILEYAEDYNTPHNTVYPYVPTEIIVDFINSNGGINVEETFANFEKFAK